MVRDATLALRCAVVAAALAVAGCGGGDTKTTVTNRMVTPQQQLQDLDRALQAGAISPAEYDQQRQKILGH